MHYVNEKEVKGIDLPGRNWKKLIVPETSGCRNMMLGVVAFPPGSDPGTHIHEHEEEIIYVISGQGESKVADKIYHLEPGVSIFTEPGIAHGVKTVGTEPLVVVSVFSPPTQPGSYDKKK